MYAQNPDPAQMAHAMAAIVPIIFLFVLLFQALIVVPLWVAMKKAGLSPALSLIAIIPTLGLIIVLFILAFSTWKVVPAPQYTGAYPGQLPPQPYPPVYTQGATPITPAGTNYAAHGAYTPQPSAAYPPPPTDPPAQG